MQHTSLRCPNRRVAHGGALRGQVAPRQAKPSRRSANASALRAAPSADTAARTYRQLHVCRWLARGRGAARGAGRVDARHARAPFGPRLRSRAARHLHRTRTRQHRSAHVPLQDTIALHERPSSGMTPYGVDDAEVWLLVLQHLHNSPLREFAARLERELAARQLLPDGARGAGAPLRQARIRNSTSARVSYATRWSLARAARAL